jgi:DNA-binding CsgD family transcriptional regulator
MNPGSPLRKVTELPLLDIEVDNVRCLLLPVTRAHSTAVRLSPREHEVARLVALGHTNLAIADALGISTWTVSTYLRRMFAKFEVSNRAALVATIGASAPK